MTARGATVNLFDYKCLSLMKFPKEFTGVAFVKEMQVIEYFYKGICHRLDGPANIPVYLDRTTHESYLASEDQHRFFIFGRSVSEQQFWNHPLVIEHKLNKIAGWIVDDNDSAPTLAASLAASLVATA